MHPEHRFPERDGGLRVLVVDDNEDAADMLALQLQLRGHDVDTEYHGSSGRDALVSVRFDVAFVDIGLPGLSGYAVARQARGGLSERAFLVAVTGYGQRQDRLQALDAGFDEHVMKPMSGERLDELLDRACTRPRTRYRLRAANIRAAAESDL